MNKLFVKFLSLTFLVTSLFTQMACNKEDLTDSDNLEARSDETLFALEQRGNLGRHGCYDLVFPVTIKFSDGSQKTITSQDSLRKAAKAFHQANPGVKRERPDFVFPISVIAEDGAVIVVNSKEELLELKKSCIKNHLDSLFKNDSLRHRGFPRHDSTCFTLVFPIQVKKADGSVVTIASKEELKSLAKGEKGQGRHHGRKHGVANQLELVFPVTVTKSDGTTASVASKEDLKALRESCR
jgi:hypothetical protein